MAKNEMATFGKAAMGVITRLERENRRMKKLLTDLQGVIAGQALCDHAPCLTPLLYRINNEL